MAGITDIGPVGRTRPLGRIGAGVARERRRFAFTLIELLTVIFLVGILLALVMGLYRHAQDASNRRRAQADLGELHHALQKFNLEYGGYPGDPALEHFFVVPASDDYATYSFTNATQILAIETHIVIGSGTYRFRNWLPRDFDGLDPWRRPYQYRYDADDPDNYDLYSTGDDHQNPVRQIRFGH